MDVYYRLQSAKFIKNCLKNTKYLLFGVSLYLRVLKFRSILPFLVFSCIVLSRCNAPKDPQPISYYIDISGIQKVGMNNIHGEFVLNKKQLARFKSEISRSVTVPGLHIKTGFLSIIVTLKDGKTFVFRGNSESNLLEVSAEIATVHSDDWDDADWIVLDTKGVNFNNYKKR